MPQPSPRDAATVRIFPPLALLVTLLLGWGLQKVAPIAWPFGMENGARETLALVLGGGAILVLGIWPIVLFLRGQQNPHPWTPTPALIGAGPYRFTRNPMYLQLVLLQIAGAIHTANLWMVLVAPLLGWILQRFAIAPEEDYLERKFGDAYLDYKARVPRWIGALKR